MEWSGEKWSGVELSVGKGKNWRVGKCSGVEWSGVYGNGVVQSGVDENDIKQSGGEWS